MRELKKSTGVVALIVMMFVPSYIVTQAQTIRLDLGVAADEDPLIITLPSNVIDVINEDISANRPPCVMVPVEPVEPVEPEAEPVEPEMVEECPPDQTPNEWVAQKIEQSLRTVIRRYDAPKTQIACESWNGLTDPQRAQVVALLGESPCSSNPDFQRRRNGRP